MVSVRHVRKDEQKYYEELLRYSREHLMLYPYHLSDVLVKGLRVTPFSYYISVTSDIMLQEKSYDALPNFTAADCKFSLFSAKMLSCLYQYIFLILKCQIKLVFNKYRYTTSRSVFEQLGMLMLSFAILLPIGRVNDV